MLIGLLTEYLGKRWKLLVSVVALQLVQALCILWLPSLNADIINEGVVKTDIPRIWSTGAIMLAVALVQVAVTVGAVRISANLAASFARDVRLATYRRVRQFSLAEVGRFGAPSLITRATNDVTQVQGVVLMGLTMIVMAPIMMFGGVFMALRQDVGLSAILLVSLPALIIVAGYVLVKMTPLFGRVQRRIDRVNGLLREQLTGVRVVRAFVRQMQIRADFDADNQRLTSTLVSIGALFAFAYPAVQFIMFTSQVAVVWFGAGRIDAGAMQVGSLIAFINYFMQIFFSVLMAVGVFMMVPRAEVAAGRLRAVLETTAQIHTPAEPKPLPEGFDLEFREVEFRFPQAQEPVLSDINLRLQPGKTIGVIGATGGGKSTLLNLVPRLLDPSGGQILLGGFDLRELDLGQLRRLVAYVPQKAFLFSGTLRTTLTLAPAARGATDEEIWRALRIAQAEGFVKELKDGLDSVVEQGGTNFSGGQRQRLSIARALLTGARAYLFDDAFSALDTATDARVRAALDEHLPQAARIIVSQRVSTVRGAAEILVLDHGRIVGRGTHGDLMETCPTYGEIVQSQHPQEAAK